MAKAWLPLPVGGSTVTDSGPWPVSVTVKVLVSVPAPPERLIRPKGRLCGPTVRTPLAAEAALDVSKVIQVSAKKRR